VPLPNAKEPIRFYGNEQRTDLKYLTSTLIKRAKKSITIATYQLRDAEIITALNKRAEEGIAVEVYVHHKCRGLKKKLSPNISLFPIKISGLMHEKIVLIDRRRAFLGSTNLTRESLTMHRNLIVGFYSKDLAKALHAHLKTLPEKREPEEFCIGGQRVELHYLPRKKSLIYLEGLIRSSHKELFAAMFTLTHPLLTEAMAEHPHATVVVDHYTARGSSKKSFTALPNAFESRGLELLHHKFCLLDQKTFLFGSANWTKSAFQKNRDYIMIIHDINKKQSKFLKKLNKTILYESQH